MRSVAGLRRGPLLAVTVVAVVGAVGTYAVAQGPRSASVASGLAASPKPTLCTGSSVPKEVPGMSDSQRAAIYAAASQEGDMCYAAWLANLDTSTIDWAHSNHVATLADSTPPQYLTLNQALAAADTVIEGQVAGLGIASSAGGVTVTISVSQVFKGSSGASMTLKEGAGLAASTGTSTNTVDIEESPGNWVVTPGETVFMLSKDSLPEAFSGAYVIYGGVVKAVGGNPFASTVDGLSANAFAHLIATDLSA